MKRRHRYRLPLPGSTSPWPIKGIFAEELFDGMNTMGNLSSVVIADASIDHEKNDPTIATIVIFPDEAVIRVRPVLQEEQETLPRYSPKNRTIHINDLELLALNEGLAIATQQVGNAQDAPVLGLTDCEATIHNMSGKTGSNVTIRNVKGNDVSPERGKLHATAHEICNDARKHNTSVDIRIGRQDIRKIVSELRTGKSH